MVELHEGKLAPLSPLQAIAGFQAAIDIIAAAPEEGLSRSRRALLAAARSHLGEVCAAILVPPVPAALPAIGVLTSLKPCCTLLLPLVCLLLPLVCLLVPLVCQSHPNPISEGCARPRP